MSKNLFNLLLITVLIIHSCTSIKSTFNEEYTTKIDFKPDQYAIMSTDNQSVFLIGTTHNILSTNSRIGKVNSADGKTEWSEKVSKLGDMVNVPNNIIIIEDMDLALIFGSKSGSTFISSQYKVSAIDLKTKKQLWSRTENSSSYSMGGLYLPQNKSFMIQTPDGMQAFDIKTGEILWSFNGLSTRLNIGRHSLRLGNASTVNFIYLESLDRLLMEVQGKVTLLNPFTGKFDWQIDESIGNHLDADIFDEAGLAVFYGKTFSRSQSASGSQNTTNSSLGTLASRAISGSGKGAQICPIMLVDLHSGRITWKNEYYTNGQNQLLLTHNKLLVTGIVSYAFDIKSGDKTWQNVEDDRLRREGILGIFSEFTGMDYTSDRHRASEAVVIDNSVFVVFPELLEQGGNRNQLSIRLYDFETGEMLWKTEPERIEVREMFFERGILFLIVNGRFARASKIIALDPYSGEKLYEIDSRATIGNRLIFTDELFYTLSPTGVLSIYNIRSGEVMQKELLGRSVIDVVDMKNRLMVVYRGSFRQQDVIAFYERNTFKLIDQLEVPFYSQNRILVNNKLFMLREDPQFKGIVHLDLDKMVVHDYATVSTSGSKKSNNEPRNAILDPYKFIVSNDASHLYLVRKKKLVRYTIKS